MTDLALSEDGYLLSKRFHSGCIKAQIDLSKIDLKTPITKERMLKETDDEECFASRQPKNKIVEAHYIQELYKYDSPKPNDVVCWYDDIRVLSGSAGYVLIRDGYVWNAIAIWRS